MYSYYPIFLFHNSDFSYQYLLVEEITGHADKKGTEKKSALSTLIFNIITIISIKYECHVALS
jgi:hypothetical protein